MGTEQFREIQPPAEVFEIQILTRVLYNNSLALLCYLSEYIYDRDGLWELLAFG